MAQELIAAQQLGYIVCLDLIGKGLWTADSETSLFYYHYKHFIFGGVQLMQIGHPEAFHKTAFTRQRPGK